MTANRSSDRLGHAQVGRANAQALELAAAPAMEAASLATMLNLPNTLTLIRILTIPIFLEFLAYHLYWEALVVFAIGGFTDFFDGLAARWMNQQTALGAYLDPVADKLLVITSFIMFGAHRRHSHVAGCGRGGARCL